MDLVHWGAEALQHLAPELQGDPHWRGLRPQGGERSPALHLAIFVEPFLSYVLDGSKSIESRFSTRQCAPFRRVAAGDIILLKAASGPVKGICQVDRTWFFDLRAVSLATVRDRFAEGIRAVDDGFWKQRESAEYATLLKLRCVREINHVACPKRDRRGWVILNGGREPAELTAS